MHAYKGRALLKCRPVHTFTPYQLQVISRCTYTDSAEHHFLLLLMQCGVSDIKQLPLRALAAPRDHWQLHLFWQPSLTPRVCFALGRRSRAEARSTKEPTLYSTRKRNYKTHVPSRRGNAWCLLLRTWKMTATSVPPCTSAPRATEGPSLSGITLANATSQEQHHRPSALTLLRTINDHVVWLLDRQKGWWKLYLSSCWWKTAELSMYANQRERTFADERVSAAKHSQNRQPLPKLGLLIYPAATIHIGCLSDTGKQLPKPSEVHISILKLRLF